MVTTMRTLPPGIENENTCSVRWIGRPAGHHKDFSIEYQEWKYQKLRTLQCCICLAGI
jgi:hypothetical protein